MEATLQTIVEKNMTRIEPFSREWIVSFKDPRSLWKENWFALVFEIVCAAIVIQVFRHAKKNNPHSAYLLLAAACSTISFELLPVIPRPGYQLWWYHQGFMNVLKQRVPSYIITFFALVHCMAHCVTSRSNLPPLTRSVVTAVTALLMIIPSLWLAPRLLLLVFHFDDAVFEDQIAGVPFIQLLIIFLLFFHTSHLFHQNYLSIESDDRNTYSFIKCSFQTGFASGMYALVEQYLLYLFFKLIIYWNTAVCFIAAICILLYMAKGELKEMQMTSYSMQGIVSPLRCKTWWFVVAAMVFVSSLPLWLNTQNLKSNGDRLELGPCTITHQVANTSPLEIFRRQYICPDDTPYLKFDFHCVSRKELIDGVNNKTKHYTICGKPLENSHQIAKQMFAYSAICLIFFYSVMLFSFNFKIQEKKIEDNDKKID